MSIIDTDTDNMTSSSSGGGNGSKKTGLTGAAKKAADRKAARARTVLSEKQLNILKTCYSANPRPDALMKEQLVEMTGLSPRVIRVWFQNKRCKDKKLQNRLMEKQLQQESVSLLTVTNTNISFKNSNRSKGISTLDFNESFQGFKKFNILNFQPLQVQFLLGRFPNRW